MIYDKLENTRKYKGISRWLDKALEFLEETNLRTLPMGRTQICGEYVFANVMEARAVDEADGKFEIHRKYMDIQIDLEGTEIIQIGLDTDRIMDEFKPETDFGTVVCSSFVSCLMGWNKFIVCMEEEPHRPGIAAIENRFLKKCVVKVAVT